MDGQTTIRFEKQDLMKVKELAKFYNITPGKFIRISVDHILKTNKDWIVEEFLKGEKIKKEQKKLSKKEQEIEDVKKRLAELDAEPKKNNM